MIFKKIGNMENVEVICHYLHLSKSRELLKEKVIMLAEQMFGAGDICRHLY